MTIDITKTTPKLSDLLLASVEAKLRELNIALPGEVMEYDSSKNLASIRPLIKAKYKNESTAHDLPVINNVPIIFPRTKKAHLFLPIEAGDTGQILFNQRSLDIWLVAGGSVDPADSRMFDINDAVFIPGLFPQNAMINANPESLELNYDTAKMEITKDGKFSMRNAQAELLTELVKCLTQMVDTLTELSQNHMTNTMLGPQPPINLSAYAGIKTQLETIKSKIEALSTS